MMQDELIFRVILVLGFVAVFPVALYHRLKANASKDKLDRRQEGLFILLTLRPVALIKMMGTLAWLIHPAWMAWSSVGLPPWLRWIGVPLGVMAATLLIVTFRSLGTNITDTVVTRARHTLVTDGPYRWVRHSEVLRLKEAYEIASRELDALIDEVGRARDQLEQARERVAELRDQIAAAGCGT